MQMINYKLHDAFKIPIIKVVIMVNIIKKNRNWFWIQRVIDAFASMGELEFLRQSKTRD